MILETKWNPLVNKYACCQFFHRLGDLLLILPLLLVKSWEMFFLLLMYGPTNDHRVNLKLVLENKFYQQYSAHSFIKFLPIVIDQYLIECSVCKTKTNKIKSSLRQVIECRTSNYRDFGPTIDLGIKLKMYLETRRSVIGRDHKMIKFCYVVLMLGSIEMKLLSQNAFLPECSFLPLSFYGRSPN